MIWCALVVLCLAQHAASATWTVTVYQYSDPGLNGFQLTILIDGSIVGTDSDTGSWDYAVTVYPGETISASLVSLGSADYDLFLFDGSSTLIDSSETMGVDSVSGTEPVPSLPDLVIQSISHSPASPQVGNTVTFTVMVRNQGDADAGTFNVGFWAHRTSAPVIGTTPDADGDVSGGLSAGASTTVQFSLTANAAGSYTSWGYADRYNGTGEVAESSEGNNAGPSGGHAWTVTSPAPTYDNAVQSVTLTPSTLDEAGGSVAVSASMGCVSGTWSADIAAFAYLSDDTVLDGSDQQVASGLFPSPWPAGTYYNCNFGTVTFPARSAGTYYVIVDLVEGGSSSANDTAHTTCVYTGVATHDNAVQSVTLTPSSITTGGGGVTVVARMGCIAGSWSLAITAEVYLSANGTIGATDTLLTTQTFAPPWPAGSYFNCSFGALSFPSRSAGTQYVIVRIVEGGTSSVNDTGSATITYTAPSDDFPDETTSASSGCTAGTSGGAVLPWALLTALCLVGVSKGTRRYSLRRR